jgi:hypothetical protein
VASNCHSEPSWKIRSTTSPRGLKATLPDWTPPPAPAPGPRPAAGAGRPPSAPSPAARRPRGARAGRRAPRRPFRLAENCPDFPPRLRINRKVVRWDQAQIVAWIESRKEAAEVCAAGA